jgi:hypothetical protein
MEASAIHRLSLLSETNRRQHLFYCGVAETRRKALINKDFFRFFNRDCFGQKKSNQEGFPRGMG